MWRRLHCLIKSSLCKMSSEAPALRSLQAYTYSDLKGSFSGVPKVPLYINGKLVESKADMWIPVHNPVSALLLLSQATQEVVSLAPQTTEEEIDQAISAAHEAFLTWRKTSIIFRQQRMFELQRLIKENMVSDDRLH